MDIDIEIEEDRDEERKNDGILVRMLISYTDAISGGAWL